MGREIDRFREQYEMRWTVAGGEYQVTEKLEKLLEIASICRERKVSPDRLADGAEVAEALVQDGVDELSKTVRFIHSVVRKGKDEGYGAERIMSHCSELDRLKNDYGDFDEIKPDWETIGKQLPKMREELSKVEEEIKQRKKDLQNLNGNYSVTEENLEGYVTVREKLRSLGLDIENHLDETVNVLINLKEHNFKPRSVVSDLKQSDMLKSRLKKLGDDLEKTNSSLQQTNVGVGQAESELEGKQETLALVKRLEATHLGIEGIEDLVDAVVKISSKNQMDVSEALERFQNDVLKNYGPVLALGSKVKALETRNEFLLNEGKEIKQGNERSLNDANNQLDLINTEIRKKTSQIESYTILRTKGVTDKIILALRKLLDEAAIDDVWESVEHMADLRAVETQRTKEINQIEEQRKKDSAALSVIQDKKLEVESSISELRKAAVKEITETSSVATNVVKEISDNATSTVNGVFSDASEKMSKLTSDVSSLDGTVLEKKKLILVDLEQVDKESKDLGARFVERANQIGTTALRVGREIGHHEAIVPLLKFAETGKGKKEEVLPMCSMFLGKLEDFAKEKNMLDIAAGCDTLLDMIRREF